MILTFTYANGTKPIAGVKIVMTESDGTVTVLVTDANGQITLPSTSNTYTLSASLNETGEDPISLIDAIQILQYAGELRTLTDDQKTAADVNNDGEVDVLDALWILQHQGELRTLDSSLLFLDTNTGQPLSQTTFSSNDTPTISVVRKGDVDGDFDPSLITDHAPIITGKTTLVIDENETSVSTLIGSDADGDTLTYSITGGVDQSLFTIDASTGVLSFKTGPDYEDPTDSDGDNLYDIEVSVSDGTNSNTQALIVSVLDLNEKLGLTNKVINENEAGATVGDLSINETDFGNTNISYVLSGDDAQYFSLDGNTIKLNSDVSANYENKTKYTLTVTATNADGETITEKVVVKIANVNEEVNLVTEISNQSNDEDAGFSFAFSSTTFSDIDGDTLTYTSTLSDGSTLPSWLNFNAATRTFSGTPLNGDVGVINVTITASDGSFTATDTFSLTVINTNDDPTAVNLSATTIDENSEGGVIGNITTTDDDNINGDSHTYALSGNDANSFEVVNGQLKLKAGINPNYEVKTSYEVTVTSTDESGSTIAQNFDVGINNINEAPTSINLSAAVIDENDTGASVGDLSSVDEDAGDTVTYTLSGTDAGFFEVVNNKLQLKNNLSANYESKSSLSVTINANDSGGLSFSQTFNVTVNNINDAPTDITLSSYGVRDDVDAAEVGNITVSDEDSSDTHTYSLSDDRFEIVNGKLKLKAGNSVQYSSEKTITLTITATDSSGVAVSKEITITVGSVIISSTSFVENAAGAQVGDLTIIDDTFSNNITYVISGNDADSFEIINGALKLKNSVTADFESKASYSITITASDDASHEASVSYTLQVTDNNDAPTVSNAIANQSVNEDSGLSFTVPSDAFNDVDSGDSLTYTATLADGSSLPSWLSFNASTQVFSGTPLNDNVGDISVKVTATDSSSVAVSDNFTLTINNTNDAPTGVSLSATAINENSSGVVIGNLSTSDVDSGDSFTYTLSGDDASSFEVVNGQLKLKSSVSANYESKTSYAVTVTSTDSGSATAQQSFTVTVNDVNEAPTAMSISNSSIDESHLGITVGNLSVTDADANSTFTYSVSGTHEAWFEVTSSGVLKLKSDAYADYERFDSMSVIVTATDQGGLTYAKTFSISINDLAYATPYCPDIVLTEDMYGQTSSNALISALLLGWTLDSDDDASTPLTVTYSIITTDSVFASDYYWLEGLNDDDYPDDNFLLSNNLTPSSAFQAAVDTIFGLYSEITGITFVKVAETSTQCGDIRIGLNNMESTGLYGVTIAPAYSLGSGGIDVWINNTVLGNSSWGNGSNGFQTLIHEIGHTLGLSHPHDSSSYNDSNLSTAWDAVYYTQMAYTDFVGDDTNTFSIKTTAGGEAYPYTPMYLDIKALQWIYCWNAQTNAWVYPDKNTGDTAYTFDGIYNYTIYDTGGTDTLDFSAYSFNLTINLDEPLSFIGSPLSTSSSGHAELVYDNGEAYSGYTLGIYNYEEMENVNAGSGNDTITCNSSINIINCGSGNDTVWAVGAGDTARGDAGNDYFYPESYSVNLIDGSAGDDYLAFKGSLIDVRNFSDAQLTSIENIDIQWSTASILKISKQFIIDLEASVLIDVDGDGDNDAYVFIYADAALDQIQVNNEGWAFLVNVGAWAYYYNDSKDTWLIVTKDTSVVVNTSNEKPIKDDSSIITDPDEEGTPATPENEESNPSEIDLPGLGLWVENSDLDNITLPDLISSPGSSETINLEGLLGFDDSLALDFDAFSEDSVVADVQPVKIVPTVTYHAAMEYHEHSSIEDLVYSSELG